VTPKRLLIDSNPPTLHKSRLSKASSTPRGENLPTRLTLSLKRSPERNEHAQHWKTRKKLWQLRLHNAINNYSEWKTRPSRKGLICYNVTRSWKPKLMRRKMSLLKEKLTLSVKGHSTNSRSSLPSKRLWIWTLNLRGPSKDMKTESRLTEKNFSARSKRSLKDCRLRRKTLMPSLMPNVNNARNLRLSFKKRLQTLKKRNRFWSSSSRTWKINKKICREI